MNQPEILKNILELNYLENKGISYDQRAVRFYAEPKTKKYADLKERYEKATTELKSAQKTIYYNGTKIKSRLV